MYLASLMIDFSDSQQSLKLAEVILIFLSLWMVSMLFIRHLYSKLFSIFCFAFHATISNNLLYSKNYTLDISKLLLNFVVVYLAIEGSFEMNDIQQQIENRREKLLQTQNYYDEGWYPLQLPVEDNDMQSEQKQVQRLRYLLDKSDQQILKAVRKTQQNRKSNKRKQLRKMRQQQFQKHYKEQIKKIDKLKQQKLFQQLNQQKKQEKRSSIIRKKKQKVKNN